MGFKRWNPGCCVCSLWGIERQEGGQLLNNDWGAPAINIYQDINRLNGLVLFLNGFASGRYPGTGDADWESVSIPEEDWPILKAWIEAGGVMMTQMEYFITAENGLRTYYNDLFDYLGTDLFIDDVSPNFRNEGCNLDHASIINTAANAPVMENVDELHHALIYEGITGGTWLAKWQDEFLNEGILVTAASVGSGYVFLTADRNISSACGSYFDEDLAPNSNYQFFENIFTKDVLL